MERDLMLVGAYLLGSIPFAWLFVKAAGRGDVRRIGSGNVGATTAMRAAGWKIALPIALLDIGKGIAAVLLMRAVTPNPDWAAAAGFAAVVGHCFPVWLKFSGGKGVATGAGVFFTLAWPTMVAVAVVWLVVLALFRTVSLASVIAAASLPVVLFFLAHPTSPVMVCAVLTVAVIIWRHRGNLARLARREEPHFGEKKR
jgi:glycerol-3-phosphate acyltransferase PlsY